MGCALKRPVADFRLSFIGENSAWLQSVSAGCAIGAAVGLVIKYNHAAQPGIAPPPFFSVRAVG
jgi:hypothetical protein